VCLFGAGEGRGGEKRAKRGRLYAIGEEREARCKSDLACIALEAA